MKTSRLPNWFVSPKRESFFQIRFGIRLLLILIFAAACGMASWASHRDAIAQREAAVNAIASAPDPLGNDFNPVALIRAVNKLHALGRREALTALKQFDSTYPNEGYHSPHQSLELVMPLLFDRRNPEDKYPCRAYFTRSEVYELTEDAWDSFIVTEDDVPFHTVVIGGYSGMPGDQSYLIQWANDHARMRESPLSPGNLFDAAEKVMAKLDESMKDEVSRSANRHHIRMQVYRAVKPFLGLSSDDDSLAPYEDEHWQTLKSLCTKLNIVWNAGRQAFVASSSNALQPQGASRGLRRD